MPLYLFRSLSLLPCRLMLIDFDWSWLIQINANCWWCWLELIDTDADWCWLMLIYCNWSGVKLSDADWCCLILIDTQLKLTKFSFRSLPLEFLLSCLIEYDRRFKIHCKFFHYLIRNLMIWKYSPTWNKFKSKNSVWLQWWKEIWIMSHSEAPVEDGWDADKMLAANSRLLSLSTRCSYTACPLSDLLLMSTFG